MHSVMQIDPFYEKINSETSCGIKQAKLRKRAENDYKNKINYLVSLISPRFLQGTSFGDRGYTRQAKDRAVLVGLDLSFYTAVHGAVSQMQRLEKNAPLMAWFEPTK